MKLRRCFRCFKRMPDPIQNDDGTYTLECENCKKEGVTVGIYHKSLDELINVWNILTPEEGFLLDSEDPKRIISSISGFDSVDKGSCCFILDGKRIDLDTNHDLAIKDLLRGRYEVSNDPLNLNAYEDIMKSIDLCKVSFHCNICDIAFNARTCSKRSKLAMIDMFQTNTFYENIKKISFLIFKDDKFEIKSFTTISDCILFLSDM